MRPAGATAIVVVFLLVAYLGLSAVHGGAFAPAVAPTTPAPTASAVDDQPVAVGTVLGSWSSDAQPVRYGGTVTPGGRALSVTITCSGDGSLALSLSHVFDQDGSCTGGEPQTGRSSAGIDRPVVVKIRPHGGRVTWSVTVRAAAPTTFTPAPVRAVDDQGRPVPYCTSDALSARYVHVPEPEGVTATTTGEVVVTNTGSRRCAVSGYPAGSFLDAAGAAVGHRANMHTDTRSYSTRRTLAPVLMQPGGHAYLQIDAGHADTIEHCRPTTSTALRFTGDDDGFSPPVAFTVSIPPTRACSNAGVLQLFATLYVDYPADLRTPAQISKAAACRLDELAIRLRATPDQQGEQTGAISYTNTGPRSCHLNGTPALTFLTTDDTPTGRPTGVRLHGAHPAALDDGYEVLARGETVYVHFAIQNAAAVPGCRPTTVRRLRTTTGEFGATAPLALVHAVRACTDVAVTQLRSTGFISEKEYTMTSLPRE